jgi:hypothetical protein
MAVYVDVSYTPLWHGSDSRKNVQAQRRFTSNDTIVSDEMASLWPVLNCPGITMEGLRQSTKKSVTITGARAGT